LLLDSRSHTSRTPIRLALLEVQFALACRITDDLEQERLQTLTAITCRSLDPVMTAYFAHVAETIVSIVGVAPLSSEVAQVVRRLTELFQNLSRPSGRSVIGLFGELLIINMSQSPRISLTAWRSTVDKDARRPVPKSHLRHLANFALWLFGSDKKAAVVKDSRQVDAFGQILESKKAIEYLERTEQPSFDIAFQIAGGDEPEIVRLIERAADNLEAALSRAHRYAKSKNLRAAAERVGQDTFRLLSLFPGLQDALLKEAS
jgi:hypothetical protein